MCQPMWKPSCSIDWTLIKDGKLRYRAQGFHVFECEKSRDKMMHPQPSFRSLQQDEWSKLILPRLMYRLDSRESYIVPRCYTSPSSFPRGLLLHLPLHSNSMSVWMGSGEFIFCWRCKDISSRLQWSKHILTLCGSEYSLCLENSNLNYHQLLGKWNESIQSDLTN